MKIGIRNEHVRLLSFVRFVKTSAVMVVLYYICSPTRYTTFVMVEYLFTICLTARHVSDLQVHPQENL